MLSAGHACSETFRVAIYHTELSRDGPGLLLRDILKGDDPQIGAVINVITANAPDILVLADFDFDAEHLALTAFADALGGYPYSFANMPNRGVQSGLDADRDGRFGEPEDAQGYGRFAGDGGLAILSKFPILNDQAVDFSGMHWTSLLENNAPKGTETAQRLSTTAHWQIPISVSEGKLLNLLTWHATAPVFDGPEDRNGWRNHDETAFWLDWLDDRPSLAPVILAGIANIDPVDGEGRRGALDVLLRDESLQDPEPKSIGGATSVVSGVNRAHQGDPALDTVDWPDEGRGPGNLRVSYVLPSADFTVLASGVLWPQDPNSSLGRDVRTASRHRLVWVDLAF